MYAYRALIEINKQRKKLLRTFPLPIAKLPFKSRGSRPFVTAFCQKGQDLDPGKREQTRTLPFPRTGVGPNCMTRCQ